MKPHHLWGLAKAGWRRWRCRPPIPADHILALVSTGHGASLAYLGRDGRRRASVLDRWAGEKHTLLLTTAEDRDLRRGQSAIDRSMRDTFHQAFDGRIPPSRRLEDVLVTWVSWLLRGTGISAADIDLLIISDTSFATNPFRLGGGMHRYFPRARIVGHLEHHEIHQRQAFWQSGFERAAVLTLDTCGEPLKRLNHRKLCGTLSVADRSGLDAGTRAFETMAEYPFPEASAGLLYDVVTDHLGFQTLGQQGKTMALAAGGTPVLLDQLASSLVLRDDGSFRFLDRDALATHLARHVPRRHPREALLPEHADVAHLGQALLERILCHAFERAMALTDCRHLTYAGGVALNCVANEVARQATRPVALYIAPNPGDTGQALGCALWAAYELACWPASRADPAAPALGSPAGDFLGPRYTAAEVESAVRQAEDELVSRSGEVCRFASEDQAVASAARLIANGSIVARYGCGPEDGGPEDGGAEFGPRALGNRSILADPRRPDSKDHVNARVKFREAFRPFAPSVLESEANLWFELGADERAASPYMLRAVPVRADKRELVPAIVHLDGTARVQTVGAEAPGYRRLIEAFELLSGVPMLLDTSFNVAGKPIVETPTQGVDCFLGTAIDALLLGPWLLTKRPLREMEHEARPIQGEPAPGEAGKGGLA